MFHHSSGGGLEGVLAGPVGVSNHRRSGQADARCTCHPFARLCVRPALHAAPQGLMPRGFLNACCAVLTGWLTPLIQAVHGVMFDRIARRHAKTRFADLWAAR